jgi:hypothetical protein
MQTADLISAVADALMAIAGVTAVVIGVRGLRTWREQMKGQADYELARRVLRATYKVRDAFSTVRNPFISPEELGGALRNAGVETSGLTWQDHPRGLGLVYGGRFAEIYASLRELESEAVEAEILWGTAIQDALGTFKLCAYELKEAIDQYISWRVDPDRYAFDDLEEEQRTKDIVHMPFTGDRKDEFAFRLQPIIRKVEAVVKPHLRH